MQPQYSYTLGDIARFWSKVNKDGPLIRPDLGPCWPWTKSTDGGGYGKFYLHDRKLVSAHVVAFELTNGPVPDGFYVCHRAGAGSPVNRAPPNTAPNFRAISQIPCPNP